LQKQFGKTSVLHSVDLLVNPGEFVGFVGPNGAGKSTSLRILMGLVFASSGKVRVLGMDPARESLAIRKRCSYLPGETSIYQQMTGGEFLQFALSFYPQQAELAEELRATFPLPLEQRVRSYSSGMKQKLALMASLIPDVDLYILDEPDRALDASARLQLRIILQGLKARGKSILLNSHHLSEIEALAERTVFILDGRTVPDERVDSARESLRKEITLRLDGELELPPGAENVTRQGDGSIKLRSIGNPMEWLAKLPADRVQTVEVGATRLEDIYSLLTNAGNRAK
jgi:ABC-2 type transport system ATP-binding protein